MDYNLIFSDNPYYIIAHLACTTQTSIILIKVFTSYTQYVPLLTKIWIKLFLLKIKSNYKKEKYRSAALELMCKNLSGILIGAWKKKHEIQLVL